MLALGASCPWFKSKYPYLNGLCSVIRLAQDICNVLEEFKSHKVHTMFSCFHNVELLLEPSFEQLEVKETTSLLLSSVVKNSSLTRKRSQVQFLQEQQLLGYSWKVKQKTVNLQMRVQFPLPQLIGTQFNGKTSDSKSER